MIYNAVTANPKSYIYNIDLRSNYIRESGLNYIAQTISLLPDLKYLSLEWNNLRLCKADTFFMAIREHKTLNRLSLRCNHIGSDCIYIYIYIFK